MSSNPDNLVDARNVDPDDFSGVADNVARGVSSPFSPGFSLGHPHLPGLPYQDWFQFSDLLYPGFQDKDGHVIDILYCDEGRVELELAPNLNNEAPLPKVAAVSPVVSSSEGAIVNKSTIKNKLMPLFSAEVDELLPKVLALWETESWADILPEDHGRYARLIQSLYANGSEYMEFRNRVFPLVKYLCVHGDMQYACHFSSYFFNYANASFTGYLFRNGVYCRILLAEEEVVSNSQKIAVVKGILFGKGFECIFCTARREWPQEIKNRRCGLARLILAVANKVYLSTKAGVKLAMKLRSRPQYFDKKTVGDFTCIRHCLEKYASDIRDDEIGLLVSASVNISSGMVPPNIEKYKDLAMKLLSSPVFEHKKVLVKLFPLFRYFYANETDKSVKYKFITKCLSNKLWFIVQHFASEGGFVWAIQSASSWADRLSLLHSILSVGFSSIFSVGSDSNGGNLQRMRLAKLILVMEEVGFIDDFQILNSLSEELSPGKTKRSFLQEISSWKKKKAVAPASDRESGEAVSTVSMLADRGDGSLAPKRAKNNLTI